MIETIISNNCIGGAVCHELGMEFRTPTINLQILPEEFPDFCANLKDYMAAELKEYKELYGCHELYLKKMFGGIPQMPLGILNESIMVCFQHYQTFKEAKEKWDERKAKINYDHIGYIMHARGPEYESEAKEFLRLNLPNKLCITENFTIPGGISLIPKAGDNGFSCVNGKLLVTQAADYKTWRAMG